MFKVMTSPAGSGVGDKEFRHALGHFASGVTIITTMDSDGVVHGMTATAFSSLSMRPPLVLVAVTRGTRCHRQLIAGQRFGVSILRADQIDLSRHFGGTEVPDIAPRFTPLGEVEVLEGALATLACRIEEPPLAGGDHSIFIGLVTNVVVATANPLIHFAGRYRTLVDEGNSDP